MEQSPRSPKLGNLTCVLQKTHLQALFTYACLGNATLNFVRVHNTVLHPCNTVKTHPIEGRHFIFLFIIFSQHVVDQNSPCSPPPANGQRRGCLWDAYAARLANGEWRCMGRHHLAHRGSSRFGDGDAAAWRAVTGRRNRGAHSYVFLSLPFLCADGFAVVRWGCMSGPWGKGGQGVYRPDASLAAVCRHPTPSPLSCSTTPASPTS